MLGREGEGDPVIGIAQERLARCDGLQDAGVALLAKVFGDAAKASNQAGVACRSADAAGRDIEGGDQGFRTMPDILELPPPACPGFIGGLGAARSSAWIPVISPIETVCTPRSAAAAAAVDS